ncbi:MAG: pilus assembly FimT family protein [Acidobacteriota bacterium]
MATSPHGQRGFSLIDLLMVASVIMIVSAIAFPTMLATMDRMRLGQATREVERELQTAKARSVAKGRPMRVRFNCPVAGQYRAVELIGSPSAPVAADTAADRCSATTYPYPASDRDPLTRPNLDGPLRRLDESVTFSASETIEFWPDGTARRNDGTGNPWPLIPVNGISIQLSRNSVTSTITVNGLGKVQLQQAQ